MSERDDLFVILRDELPAWLMGKACCEAGWVAWPDPCPWHPRAAVAGHPAEEVGA